MQAEWIYYNDVPNQNDALRALDSFMRALAELGADRPFVAGDPRIGSVWSKVKAIFKSPEAVRSAMDRVQAAMAGSKSHEATANLIRAVSPEGADNVVIVGNRKLLVKRTEADGSTSMYVGRLSRKDERRLSENPQWFDSPDKLPFLLAATRAKLPAELPPPPPPLPPPAR